MSTYAILGATGQTGSSILRVLIDDKPASKINVLVRSRSKLEKSFPSLPSNPNIHIFEADITNIPVLAASLAGTTAAFLAVAVTQNAPGCNISFETAHAVIKALQQLKAQDPTFKPPRLVILSSASLDDKFWPNGTGFLHKLLYAANAHIYDDLARAETYLRKHEDWVDMTFVMPGGLSHDVRQECEVSEVRQQTFISFFGFGGGDGQGCGSGGGEVGWGEG